MIHHTLADGTTLTALKNMATFVTNPWVRYKLVFRKKCLNKGVSLVLFPSCAQFQVNKQDSSFLGQRSLLNSENLTPR